MNRILCLCLLVAVFLASPPVQAEEYYPFDFWSSSEPFVSLNQAVQIADNATVFANNRILELGTGWPVILGLWVKTFTLDFFVTSIWSHEAAHQSVLTVHGIDSRNAWIDWAVNDVATASLQNLKRDHYTDFIRLHTAGIESQGMRVVNLEEMINFDRNSRDAIAFPLYYNKFYIFLYLNSSITNDAFAVAQNEFESAERDRDIVGHDLYGMVRHLYTPEDTGYTTRYTYRADLSNEEEDYVRRVESRSWLTFLDTNLFAEPIEVRGTAFSTGLNYYLAPFGDVIEWNTYVSSPIGNNRATIRAYGNHERFFPGLELTDYRRRLGPFSLTTSVSLWQQPDELRFFTHDGQLGAQLDLSVEYLWKDVAGIYLGLKTKTDGFVPGYVQRDMAAETAITIGGSYTWSGSAARR